MHQLVKSFTVALCAATLSIGVYHYYFAPKIYIATVTPILDQAKEKVLSGEKNQDDFLALVKNLETQIEAATTGKFQGDRVVLVDKAVFAGGTKIKLKSPFENPSKDESITTFTKTK